MTATAINIHATVIVAGTAGLAFVGPSGCGKSSIAFTCLAEARAQGKYAALIADDRVDVSLQNGRIVASRPAAIAGLIELRHAGIVNAASQKSAVIDACVMPIGAEADRMPEENEDHQLAFGIRVPLLRIPVHTTAPLAFLEALLHVRSDDFTGKGIIF